MQLILNGDDLGYSPAVNRSILALHEAGWLTSTSMLVNLRFSQDAAELLRESGYPSLGVGIHLNLSKGRPCLAPTQIPTLVNKAGEFWSSPILFQRMLIGMVSLQEVRAELQAQINVARDYGIAVTHLDSHSHWHAIPRLNRLLEGLAIENGIDGMRQTRLSQTLVPRGLWLATRQGRIQSRVVNRPDYLLSLHQWLPSPGRSVTLFNVDLVRLLAQENTTAELVLHPGVPDDPDFPVDTLSSSRRGREVEFVSSGRLAEWIDCLNAVLINYSDM